MVNHCSITWVSLPTAVAKEGSCPQYQPQQLMSTYTTLPRIFRMQWRTNLMKIPSEVGSCRFVLANLHTFA